MTDPRRLKDEYAGDLQGELLRSVASDAPRGDGHHRTLVALGFGGTALGIPAATTAAAATKVTTGVTLAVFVKWMGIGMGVALVAAGAVHESSRFLDRGRSSSALEDAPAASPALAVDRAAEPRVAPNTESPPTPSESAGDNPIGVVAAETVAPSLTHPPRSAPIAARDTSAEPTPSPARAEPSEPLGLSGEVAMLDAARQMLSTNPTGTLRALDSYQSQFPHGDLAPEALVLRIEALVRSGQQASADNLGREFLERNPGSPHARKIRALLSGQAGSSQ